MVLQKNFCILCWAHWPLLGVSCFGTRFVAVCAVLAKLKIDQAVVPGGCTKYVQAPDVCWNQPFKADISCQHEEWLFNGEKEYTRGVTLVLLRWRCIWSG